MDRIVDWTLPWNRLLCFPLSLFVHCFSCFSVPTLQTIHSPFLFGFSSTNAFRFRCFFKSTWVLGVQCAFASAQIYHLSSKHLKMARTWASSCLINTLDFQSGLSYCPLAQRCITLQHVRMQRRTPTAPRRWHANSSAINQHQ